MPVDIQGFTQAAKQQGYSDSEIKSFLQKKGASATPTVGKTPTSTDTTSQKLFGLLNSIGLSAVPTVLGGAFEAGRAGLGALGVKNVYGNPETGQTIQNPFLSEGRLKDIQQKPVETVARQTAGLASYAIPGASLEAKTLGAIPGAIGKAALTGAARGGLFTASIPGSTPAEIGVGAGVGAVAEPLVAYMRTYGTFKQLGKLQDSAVQEAEGEGVVSQWSSVMDKAKATKLYNSPAGKKAIDNILADYAPSTLSDTITPSELMNTRDTITEVYGSKSLFGDIFAQPESKVNTKAAEVVRRAVSSELHTAVPKTQVADYFVAAYNKGQPLLGGDIPQKILKLAAGYGGVRGLRALYQSIFYTGKAIGG